MDYKHPGEAIPLVSETHNSKDYIEFLKILDNKYPKGDKIRIVLDNLKVHTSKETRNYIATVPGRFDFVFTPKHGSWLNMIEGFFSKMTRQMLRGIRVKSKRLNYLIVSICILRKLMRNTSYATGNTSLTILMYQKNS